MEWVPSDVRWLILKVFSLMKIVYRTIISRFTTVYFVILHLFRVLLNFKPSIVLFVYVSTFLCNSIVNAHGSG